MAAPKQEKLGARPKSPADGQSAARGEARSESGSLTPVTARGEATKRKILDAAEAVFGELGYYEASVSEITRRAGVAQGTFYIYYHTKREIFVELIEDLGRQLRMAIRAATAGLTDRLEVERHGFVAFFTFVAQHRQIYRIVQEAERVAPEAAEAYYQNISRGYERGLRAAMEAGTIRPLHPEATAYALMGIGHFLALRWLVRSGDDGMAPGDQMPDDVVASVLEFITHGLALSSDADEPHSDSQSPSTASRSHRDRTHG
ncbi:MAG: TetR/AcrR family transcriptional regulator [Ktedonobacterales bacterium]